MSAFKRKSRVTAMSPEITALAIGATAGTITFAISTRLVAPGIRRMTSRRPATSKTTAGSRRNRFSDSVPANRSTRREDDRRSRKTDSQRITRGAPRRRFSADAGQTTSSSQRQSSRAPGRRGGRPQHPFALSTLWQRNITSRPTLFFGHGNVSKMLDVVERLSTDSPAAAIAILDFIVQHNCAETPFARVKLTTLLQRINPNSTAQASSRANKRETEQTRDGRLTSLLSYCELRYLGHFYGSHRLNKNELRSLINELQVVSRTFAGRDSNKRRASAHIVTADICMWLGDYTRANDEMSSALVLLGTAYDNRELMDLTVGANGAGIIQQTLSNPQAAERARALVSSNS